VSSDTPAAVVLAALASLVLALGFAGLAHAASPCGERVLLDWSDNGRVDRLYRLSCYEDALDDLPADIRDYTDAADVIERALYSAVREGTATATPRSEESSSTSRVVLLAAFAAASVALAAAAVAGVLARGSGSGETNGRR
jgi:hypothetical protein